jgi:hypothetical protein
MSDELHFAVVMLPPAGFVEAAVSRGLARVQAEEALVAVERTSAAHNDVHPRGRERGERGARKPRKRLDSGVIDTRELTITEAPASVRGR